MLSRSQERVQLPVFKLLCLKITPGEKEPSHCRWLFKKDTWQTEKESKLQFFVTGFCLSKLPHCSDLKSKSELAVSILEAHKMSFFLHGFKHILPK